MTNVGIVHPEPGYHQALRELTRKYGTLLIIDETHTICAGPGGYTRAENLDPDFFIFGKAIAGGVPGRGLRIHRRKSPTRIAEGQNLEDCDTGGIGGTLAGNALSLAAMRATLDQSPDQRSLRPHDSHGRTLDRRRRKKRSPNSACPGTSPASAAAPNISFRPSRPKNGTQAHDAMDFELERFMHLYAMNRGILLTPFHNMALMSPQTDPDDVDQHTRVFREAVKELVGIALESVRATQSARRRGIPVPSVTLFVLAMKRSDWNFWSACWAAPCLFPAALRAFPSRRRWNWPSRSPICARRARATRFISPGPCPPRPPTASPFGIRARPASAAA